MSKGPKTHHVVPNPDGGWDVKKGGASRASSHHDTKRDAIGYEEHSQTLQVEFNNGGTYQYFDVPQAIFDGLLGASSVGQYLNQHVKGSYRYSRV